MFRERKNQKKLRKLSNYEVSKLKEILKQEKRKKIIKKNKQSK